MECPICLENTKNKFIVKTPCKHVFCMECVLQFTNTICPLCRTNNELQIPTKLLNIIKKNDKLNQFKNLSTHTPNIHNLNDFPPLG